MQHTHTMTDTGVSLACCLLRLKHNMDSVVLTQESVDEAAHRQTEASLSTDNPVQSRFLGGGVCSYCSCSYS